MRWLPNVPEWLRSGRMGEYLVRLVSKMDRELSERPVRKDGALYVSGEEPLAIVGDDGVTYYLAVEGQKLVITDTEGTEIFGANLAETDQANTFTGINTFTQDVLATGFEATRDMGTWFDAIVSDDSNSRVFRARDSAENEIAYIQTINFDGAGGGYVELRGLWGAPWTAITLQNGWVNYGGGFQTARYSRTAAGLVVVEGLIKDGTTTAGTVLFNLPAEFRPNGTLILTTTSVSALARVDINPTGNVVVQGTINSGWLAINFQFYAGT